MHIGNTENVGIFCPEVACFGAFCSFVDPSVQATDVTELLLPIFRLTSRSHNFIKNPVLTSSEVK